jgi:hypothetical protein
MFEPEKEIEAVNKRVDRLTEYTSYNCDLQIKMLNRLEAMVNEVNDLREQLLDITIYLYEKIEQDRDATFRLSARLAVDVIRRDKHYQKKSSNRQVNREMELLASEVDYLRDKVFERKDRNTNYD